MKHNGILVGAMVLMGLGFLASCHKESNEFCEYGFIKATVVYTGAPEVDGCGWTIQVGEVAFHPVNLDLQYQINDLPILIKYRIEDEDFHCGRGGMTWQSIWLTEVRYHGQNLRNLPEDQWDKYSMDPFRMDSAYITDDWLMLQVSYSGGCRDHEFNLWRLPPNALDPPPVELALSHNANGDMCEAYITRWLSFSLVPLREKGKSEIKFLLRGSPEMSAYFGEFTYKY